jgi:hypothetical protein
VESDVGSSCLSILCVALGIFKHTPAHCFFPQRRRFISPRRVGARTEAKQRAEAKRAWKAGKAVLRVEIGRYGHTTLRSPPPGLQWSRDMAAMALLVRARNARKSEDGAGQQVVGDPEVLRRRRLERLHCAGTDNGRSSHQAGGCSSGAWWA